MGSADARTADDAGARAPAGGARRWRAAAVLAGAAVLAATFAAYLDPDRVLDLGQLMLLCGFR
jgi:hypothetical protein